MSAKPIIIHGENFQSWSDFTLKLQDFTTVVGPTDLGKSALSRSLKGILRNEISENHIRTGQAKVEVMLQVGDTTITATRPRKKSTSYKINDIEYAKLNQSVPEPITELGYGEIEIGPVTIDPIFSRQSDRQFLIDESQSPAELNLILGGFASTERLDKGKKAGKAQVSEKDSEAKVIARTIQELEQENSKVEPLTERAKLVQEELSQLNARLNHLMNIVETLQQLVKFTAKRATTQKVIRELTVPDITESEQALILVRQLIGTIEAKGLHSKYKSLLGSLPEIDPQPLVVLYGIIRASQALRASQDQLAACSKALQVTAGVEANFSAAVKLYRIWQAAKNVREIQGSALGVSRSKAITTITGSVTVAENLTLTASNSLLTLKGLAEFEERTKHLASLVSMMQQTQAELVIAESLVSGLEKEQQAAIIESLKVTCPECGKQFCENQKKK